MSNANYNKAHALRIEAGSCFFIGWKKPDHSESLTAHYVEYLLLLRLVILILLSRRNAQRITMITDGRGNVIAGGNNGGKSHISYKPYGEIHRTDSSGPDITRFKYTGQEEDKESGLMYYKARYYDPMIGRFLQADSVVMPESTFGMNRYMYVNGSPMNFRDDTGHIPARTWMKMAVNYYVAKEYGVAFIPGNAIKNITREAHKGRKKYLAAYMGSQMGGQMNLSPEQGTALGMYAAAGKTNIGKDMNNGLPILITAFMLNIFVNDPNVSTEDRQQRAIHLLYTIKKNNVKWEKNKPISGGKEGDLIAGQTAGYGFGLPIAWADSKLQKTKFELPIPGGPDYVFLIVDLINFFNPPGNSDYYGK